jgi:hypothetical protein
LTRKAFSGEGLSWGISLAGGLLLEEEREERKET